MVDYKTEEMQSTDNIETILDPLITNNAEFRDVEVPYSCDQCDYTNTIKRNLNNHKKSNHEEPSYFCQQCDFKARTQTGLQNHIDSKHEGRRAVAC